MPGWPAAMRVMSRNPPAASRSIVRCSSSWSVATSISVRRRELRHVTHERDELVVVLGRDRHDLGAELAQITRSTACTPARRCSRSASAPRSRRRTASASAPSTPSCSDPPSGGRRRSAPRRVRPRPSTSRDDRRLHRPDVGDDRGAGVERGHDGRGDRAHRHRDDHEVGAARPRRRLEAATSLDRAELLGAASASLVPVEADDLVAARGEREADRAADEAGADDRDPHPATSARAGRRAASARLRGRRGGARPRGLLAVEVHHHTDRAAACRGRSPSSRAQSSGTSPRPSARAAVAGNSAVMSSVAVKMMLTRSSCAIALRSSISCDQRLRLRRRSRPWCSRRTWSRRAAPATLTGSEISRRVAPPRHRSSPSAAAYSDRTSAAVERPARAGRELRIGERTDARAHQPAHRMTDLRAHPPHHAACGLPSARSRARCLPSRDSCTTCAAHGTRRAVVELDALPQAAQRAGARDAFDLGEVRLLDTVARMREQLARARRRW